MDCDCLTTRFIESLTSTSEDMMLVLGPHMNWQEMLCPAPLSVCLLGQLVLVTLDKDVSLVSEHMTRDRFKHIFVWNMCDETKTETSKGVKKKASPRLLSAHVSPGGWTVEERGMKVKMALFDQSSEKTNLWKPKVAAYSRRGEPVTVGLLASSATVILHLHKPRKLCAGELFGKLRCLLVPPNWDAIGGMQMHLGYLYVSAGKSIYMLKITAYSTIRKLTDYKLVMKLPDTPSEIATDELGGKSICASCKGEECLVEGEFYVCAVGGQ
ncbi:uncharacterized protein LOC125376974 [Haliotis rufescens]|uniref:uncharacterized protein LOC125376974 n=1 Tax=Haliotis rufescens TaxID=6454 RepID=UPI00201F9D17|nr:uncharacterized protein LOC125376974 [Haliotis rufescens]